MGVSPKVQPINATLLDNNIETLGYTVLMGVPPKIQPINATILANNIKKNYAVHCTHGCVT